MNKIKVLFVCSHNSARSQMAEAFLQHFASDRFEAFSGGLEIGIVNPLVIKSMHSIGIDISQNKSKSVFDFYKKGDFFNYIITVCDEKTAELCPIFPGINHKLHWSFEDPSELKGSEDEVLEKINIIRDEIALKIQNWINEIQ